MDLGLRDRVYLVTGGSRGLGFAAARALVADGARVLLSGPHEASAAAAVARLSQEAGPGAAGWAVADNADPAAPGQLITAAHDRFGRLDGALISVGGSPGGSVAGTTDDAWRSAFESVFLGAVRLARVLAGSLAGRGDDVSLSGTGGSIAFVLAASVRAPLPDLAISNGLFPGLAGVVKTMADEPPTGSVSWTPCSATRMKSGPGCRRASRCAATGNPPSSGRPWRSSCPPPRPTSPAR
jgi:3-oxoacyl-[acyl-carrier protein] reductase